MRLHFKVTLAVTLCVALTAAGLYALTARSVMRSFAEVERQAVRKATEQARGTLAEQLGTLDSKMADWGYWDDMKAFAKTPTKEFIDSNLTDVALSEIGLCGVIVIGPEGTVQYRRGFDPAAQRDEPIVAEIEAMVRPGGALVRHGSTESVISAFLRTRSGLLVVSSRPILSSKKEGPAGGVLVAYQRLDGAWIARISEQLQMSLSVSGVVPGGAVEPAGGWPEVEFVSEGRAAGAGSLTDLNGERVGFRVEIDRPIHAQAVATMAGIRWILAGVGAVLIVAVVFVLRWAVTARLVRLSSEIGDVTQGGRLGSRVSGGGGDEVGKVAGAVNRMLVALEGAREDVELARHRLEASAVASNSGCVDWNISSGAVHYGRHLQRILVPAGSELESNIGAWRSRVHPEDADGAFVAIDRALAGKAGSFEIEHRLRHADGKYTWYALRGSIERDTTGRATRVLGSCVDISRHKKAEAELQRTSALMTAVLDSSPAGVVAIAAIRDSAGTVSDFTILKANQAIGAMAARPCAEIVGGRLVEHIPLIADASAIEQYRFVVETGVPVQFEQKYASEDGATGWLQISVVPLAEGLALTVSDVTNARRVKDEIDKAREAAELASRAKSSFLASVSHELRTPLNGVVGMLELLRSTSLNDEQIRYARIARESATTLLTLISDVLDLSKIEAGQMDMESIELDLHDLIERTIFVCSQGAFEKRLELVAVVDPAVPCRVKGDPTRLVQVLTNLLSNAIKFTQRGGVSMRVRVGEASEQTMTLVFDVVDTGIGISAEGIALLFRPFSQVDASTTRRFGGTGLGLAISRQICQMMDGQVTVRSVPGEGSTFTVSVQVGVVAGTAAKVCEPAGGLLVVEPNPFVAAELGDFFANAGWNAAVAPDIASAVAVGQTMQPAFVVVSSGVPSPSAVATAVGAAMEKAPVMMLMAGVGEKHTSESARREGFSDLMHRPIITATLSDQLTRKRVAAESRGALATPLRSRRLKVLVAEDNEVNQAVVQNLLTKAGLSVTIVGNGRLAVEAIAADRYDCVLMDCQMPEMDGFEASVEIRKYETRTHTPRTPIIALTANAMTEDRNKCMAAGMDGFHSKPIDAPRLMEEILRAAGPGAEAPVVAASGPAKVDATANTQQAIDLDAVLARCMGDVELLQKLMEMGRTSLPNDAAAVKAAAASSDAAALKKTSHRLKGAAANLGAKALAQVAANIEKLSQSDLAAAVEQLEGLESALGECMSAIPVAIAAVAGETSRHAVVEGRAS